MSKILKFSANWCGPCKLMKPVVLKAESEGVLVEHIDIDSQPEKAQEYGITSVPTFVKLVDNSEASRHVGVMNINQFRLFAQ